MANHNQEAPPNTTSWRIWSTAESVRNRQPSVMAVAETCLAPIFYLWLALHVGWLLPLYVAAAVAPFVLLRSDESVALGVKWASNIDSDHPPNSPPRWMILGLFFVLASYWLVVIAFWGPPFSALVAVLLLPPILLFPSLVLLLAVAIRITATAVFWREGLKSMPENFRILILCVSPSQVPELIPGLHGTTSFLSFFGFRRFVTEIDMRNWNPFNWLVRVPAKLARILLKEHGGHETFIPRSVDRATKEIVYIISALFAFAPAWAYRFTIKSTIWFWWPLAFIGGDLSLAAKPDLLRWNLIGSLWAKTSILIACLSLLAFIWTNAFLDGTIFEKNPLITPIGYFLLLDWRLQPWQVCAILASAMSVVLVFWMNDIAGRFRIAKETGDTTLQTTVMIELGWMERFARLRSLFVLSFWFLVAAHALLYLNSQMCTVHLSDSVQRLAQTVYGNRTPKSTCIGTTTERNAAH
jgi:hypothetical protein